MRGFVDKQGHRHSEDCIAYALMQQYRLVTVQRGLETYLRFQKRLATIEREFIREHCTCAFARAFPKNYASQIERKR